jgi:hypothetical protein
MLDKNNIVSYIKKIVRLLIVTENGCFVINIRKIEENFQDSFLLDVLSLNTKIILNNKNESQ